MKEMLPVNQNVLLEIEEEKEQKTEGGIIIPDTVSKEKPMMAKVVAMANIENPEINVGDTVVYKKYSGTEIELDDKKYLIIQYTDLLAKVNETEAI
jgi:chaperonin GroES